MTPLWRKLWYHLVSVCITDSWKCPFSADWSWSFLILNLSILLDWPAILVSLLILDSSYRLLLLNCFKLCGLPAWTSHINLSLLLYLLIRANCLECSLICLLFSIYCLFLSRFICSRLHFRFFRLVVSILWISIWRHKWPHNRRICFGSHVSALRINSFLHVFCFLHTHFLQSLFVYWLEIFLNGHFTDVILLLIAFITTLTTMIGAFCPRKSWFKTWLFFVINIHRSPLFYWWSWLEFPIPPFWALASLFGEHIFKSSHCVKPMRISLDLYLSLTLVLVSFFRRRLFCLWTSCHFELTSPLHELVEHIVLHDCVIQKF